MRKHLFKRNKFFNTNTGGAGFTLIEILLSIAIIAVITGSSYAVLIRFSRQQNLGSAYGVFKNNLNLAKSLASSQVVSCDVNQTLVGYRLFFPPDRTSYQIQTVCYNGSTQVFNVVRNSKLPSGITVSSDFSPILFLVISGQVEGLPPGQRATITLSGSGASQTITVFQNGRIE